MARRKKTDTRAIGLDVGLAFSKFLTGKENLHYGLWSPETPVCAANLGTAQEAYTTKLFGLLPARKGLRILDVGGGAGETAKKLLALGHSVDIVIPSPFLAARCRENTDGKARVHEATFEAFTAKQPFDICLFSESFQYIPLEISLDKAAEMLAPDGIIIVSDCFRTDAFFAAKGDGARVGGGHGLADFHKAVAARPLVVLSQEDITDAVAPTVEVEQDLFNVIGYAIQRTDEGLADSHPFLQGAVHRILRLLLNRRKRDRLDQRLNQRTRTAENFRLYNTYLMTALKPQQ